MSDFLHWDNVLDLDQILGDYTDKEDFVSYSEDDCFVAQSQTTSGSTSCICPVCNWEVATEYIWFSWPHNQLVNKNNKNGGLAFEK